MHGLRSNRKPKKNEKSSLALGVFRVTWNASSIWSKHNQKFHLNLFEFRCLLMLSHLNMSKMKKMLIFVMELHVNDNRSQIALCVILRRKKCWTLQSGSVKVVRWNGELRSPFLSCGILRACMRIRAASAFANMSLRSCYDTYEYMLWTNQVCVIVRTIVPTHRLKPQIHPTMRPFRSRAVCVRLCALSYFLSYIIFIFISWKALKHEIQWALKNSKMFCAILVVLMCIAYYFSYEFVWLLLS